MIIITFAKQGLREQKKRRYAAILKELILKVSKFSKEIRIFSDDVQAEIQIIFK